MKKLFLTLVLMLTVSFAFASMNARDKLPIKESFKIDITKNALSATVEYEYFYVGWGVGCYANIYYNGELVGTVYAYESGDTLAQATSKCYSAVRARANAFIAEK